MPITHAVIAQATSIFGGDDPASRCFRKSPEGALQQWHVLREMADVHSLVAVSDGSYIVFIYNVRGTHPREVRRGIGWLSTQTSEVEESEYPLSKIQHPNRRSFSRVIMWPKSHRSLDEH